MIKDPTFEAFQKLMKENLPLKNIEDLPKNTFGYVEKKNDSLESETEYKASEESKTNNEVKM